MIDPDLGAAPPLKPSGSRFRILSLSGGGYRGLFTACILSDIEKEAGRPLNEIFDLICGTSIGGIIATGAALGVPCEKISSSLETFGPAIFPKTKKFKALYTAKYAREPLESAIKSILPNHDLPFADIEKNAFVTALDSTTGSPHLINTRQFSSENNSSLSILDALLSTSTAPTYFPPYLVAGRSYIDGGVIANAPDLVALTQTMRHKHKDLSDCWMLSVGTASQSHASPAMQSNVGYGLAKWLKREKLVAVTLAAQEKLSIEQTELLLQNRYLRFDVKPASRQEEVLDLDKADKVATDTLKLLASDCYETFSQNSIFSRLIE